MIKSTKWLDALSIILACILINIANQSIRVSGKADYVEMFMQIILMSFSFLLPLFIFANKNKLFGIPTIFITTLLGAIIWMICNVIWGIYGDWRYISDPEGDDIFARYLIVFLFTGVTAVIFSIVILITISVVRAFANIFSKLKHPFK